MFGHHVGQFVSMGMGFVVFVAMGLFMLMAMIMVVAVVICHQVGYSQLWGSIKIP